MTKTPAKKMILMSTGSQCGNTPTLDVQAFMDGLKIDRDAQTEEGGNYELHGTDVECYDQSEEEET
jgi:hypothetical protein